MDSWRGDIVKQWARSRRALREGRERASGRSLSFGGAALELRSELLVHELPTTAKGALTGGEKSPYNS